MEQWYTRCLALGLAACLIGLSVGTLVGCGGSSHVNKAPVETPPTPLAPPALTVAVAAVKSLSLRWTAVAGATHYRLFEDSDGDAGPQAATLLAQVPSDVLSHAQQIFLPARVNAAYRVQACDERGCVDSAGAGIPDINQGIGFFKSAQPAVLDDFGEGLALSADGQVLAVGVWLEDGTSAGTDPVFNGGPSTSDIGAVYVFRRGSAGWVQEAYLKPETVLLQANFGYRLSLSDDGNALLVGAPGEAPGPPVQRSGAAYFFERGASGRWAQVQRVTPQAPQAEGQFGNSVSLSGDGQWAAVGEPGTAEGGRVSLYRRQPGAWAWQATLRGSNTESEDRFGESLQLDRDGDTLAVGAWAEDGAGAVADYGNGQDASGAAYVFRRGAAGGWTEQSYVTPPERRQGGYFGYPVVLSADGNTLVAGESGVMRPTSTAQGRVHIFESQGAGWSHRQQFGSPMPEASGDFGEKVALSADGTTLVIANAWEDGHAQGLGASPEFDGQQRNEGAVYVYRRDAAGAWSAPVYVKSSNSSAEQYFGWSLALSADGQTLAVFGSDHSGASGVGGDQSDSSVRWAGAVYLY